MNYAARCHEQPAQPGRRRGANCSHRGWGADLSRPPALMSGGGGGMGGMETFGLVPRGAFSLAASIRFLEGFTPAAYTGSADAVLELAFPVEGSWRTAGVRVRQDPAGVTAEIVSPGEPGAELAAAVR